MVPLRVFRAVASLSPSLVSSPFLPSTYKVVSNFGEMITAASLYCELIPENGEFDLISLTISSLDYLPDFKDNPFEDATKTKAETRIAPTLPMILHAKE